MKSTRAGNEECDYGSVCNDSDSASRMPCNFSGHCASESCVGVGGGLLPKDESVDVRKEQCNAVLELLLGRKVHFIASIVLV